MYTLEELLKGFSRALITRTRPDESEYICIDESHKLADDLKDLVRAVHEDGQMLPDDQRYRLLAKVIDALLEYVAAEGNRGDGWDYLEADIYTSDLTGWLHSSVRRMTFVSDVLEMDLGIQSAGALLQEAQLQEIAEIYGLVIDWLEERGY